MLVKRLVAIQRMHLVQAAPRQSHVRRSIPTVSAMHLVQAAPRQSNALWMSAEVHAMHLVQAAQSKITTCRPMVL